MKNLISIWNMKSHKFTKHRQNNYTNWIVWLIKNYAEIISYSILSHQTIVPNCDANEYFTDPNSSAASIYGPSYKLQYNLRIFKVAIGHITVRVRLCPYSIAWLVCVPILWATWPHFFHLFLPLFFLISLLTRLRFCPLQPCFLVYVSGKKSTE